MLARRLSPNPHSKTYFINLSSLKSANTMHGGVPCHVNLFQLHHHITRLLWCSLGVSMNYLRSLGEPSFVLPPLITHPQHFAWWRIAPLDLNRIGYQCMSNCCTDSNVHRHIMFDGEEVAQMKAPRMAQMKAPRMAQMKAPKSSGGTAGSLSSRTIGSPLQSS